MKVKFLRAGRWAHQDISKGQFDFVEGEEVSGVCESDAIIMKEVGLATIIGDDTFEEEVVDDVDGEDDTKSDDDDDVASDDTNGDKKPWEK